MWSLFFVLGPQKRSASGQWKLDCWCVILWQCVLSTWVFLRKIRTVKTHSNVLLGEKKLHCLPHPRLGSPASQKTPAEIRQHSCFMWLLPLLFPGRWAALPGRARCRPRWPAPTSTAPGSPLPTFPLFTLLLSSPRSLAKAACVLTVFSFFPHLMLPVKETNSSEESECDDLDPNTSMEVEAAIVVLFTTMIVSFGVFCNSDLAQVTSQSRIHGDIRAFLGVPSNL